MSEQLGRLTVQWVGPDGSDFKSEVSTAGRPGELALRLQEIGDSLERFRERRPRRSTAGYSGAFLVSPKSPLSIPIAPELAEAIESGRVSISWFSAGGGGGGSSHSDDGAGGAEHHGYLGPFKNLADLDAHIFAAARAVAADAARAVERKIQLERLQSAGLVDVDGRPIPAVPAKRSAEFDFFFNDPAGKGEGLRDAVAGREPVLEEFV